MAMVLAARLALLPQACRLSATSPASRAPSSGGVRPLCSRTAHDRTPFARFWAWTTRERPSWRHDKLEAAVALCVFGVTGSTSVALVRPALKSTLGLEGSLRDGPNSYRLLSVVLVSPIYAVLLGAFGTLAGRHTFFAGMSRRILSRFIPGVVLQRAANLFRQMKP
ncbi:hypothetical protein AB1Y20_010108 [Prymnesium parvum]|uniref:DUF6787 domain-containing protein n=1 Tax=Prymnesium parvum TaxID=97485 RepID=A0AB34K7D5_PRYPA